MKVFISWAGVRSQTLAHSLRPWLQKTIVGLETFHSDDIPKGKHWHSELVEALRESKVGIFCVTPESLRSQWMLFEAGALAQHGTRSFTYQYGLDGLSGPLSSFQSTRFEREDSRKFVKELAKTIGASEQSASEKFDETWEEFEGSVTVGMLHPVQRLIPDLPSLFERKKTFHEPFPECTNQRWDERFKRIVATLERLSAPDVEEILSSDPYQRGCYQNLRTALDEYAMHVSALLMEPRNYNDLRLDQQELLEAARTSVLEWVSSLETECRPPIFQKSVLFESESDTSKRKDMIHAMEIMIDRNQLPKEKLIAARDSLEWALDRIVFYVAAGRGRVPEVKPDELVSALKREEERARSRNAVTGLQPLYYAVECIDGRLDADLEAPTARRLRVVLGQVERFLDGDPRRDAGRHIRLRITSIRDKLRIAG